MDADNQSPSHSSVIRTPEKPQALLIPDISQALREVYKVGGLPLALVFIAAVVTFGLVVRDALELSRSLINIVFFLVVASVFLFLALMLIGYFRWRDEVHTKQEEHRLEMEAYYELYNREIESQDKFMLGLVEYATKLMGEGDAERARDVELFTKTLGGVVAQMMEIRARLRPVIEPPEDKISGVQISSVTVKA
jgi:hypothetical protein